MLIDFLVIVGINLVSDAYTKYSIYSINVPDLSLTYPTCLSLFCFVFSQEIYRITIICDLKSHYFNHLFVTKLLENISI